VGLVAPALSRYIPKKKSNKNLARDSGGEGLLGAGLELLLLVGACSCVHAGGGKR
jgi:hypothetical protein